MAVKDFLVDVAFISAPSGSGKSFFVCDYLANTKLTENEKVIVWHNMPLVVEEFSKRLKRDVSHQLKEIPKEILDGMTKKDPQAVIDFKMMIGGGNLIIIDELHNYLPSRCDRAYRDEWSVWLGEIRHSSNKIIGMTQSDTKVDTAYRNHSHIKYSLANLESRRDPILRASMHDWYNLKAKFITGYWSPCVALMEQREIHGKKVTNAAYRFYLNPEIYPLYDSYNAPVQGGAAHREEKPWEKYTRKQLLVWFFKRIWGRLIFASLVAVAFLYILFNPSIISDIPFKILSKVQERGQANTEVQNEPINQKERQIPTSTSAVVASDGVVPQESETSEQALQVQELQANIATLKMRIETLEKNRNLPVTQYYGIVDNEVILKTSDGWATHEIGKKFQNALLEYRDRNLYHGSVRLRRYTDSNNGESN